MTKSDSICPRALVSNMKQKKVKNSGILEQKSRSPSVLDDPYKKPQNQ